MATKSSQRTNVARMHMDMPACHFHASRVRRGSEELKRRTPTFNDVAVGWESYQNDVAGAHDAWIDDVVFDGKPIACP